MSVLSLNFYTFSYIHTPSGEPHSSHCTFPCRFSLLQLWISVWEILVVFKTWECFYSIFRVGPAHRVIYQSFIQSSTLRKTNTKAVQRHQLFLQKPRLRWYLLPDWGGTMYSRCEQRTDPYQTFTESSRAHQSQWSYWNNLIVISGIAECRIS